jgi:hypothetical protein
MVELVFNNNEADVFAFRHDIGVGSERPGRAYQMILTLRRLQWPARLAHSSDDYYGLKVAEILPLLPTLTDVGGGGVAKGTACSAGGPTSGLRIDCGSVATNATARIAQCQVLIR